MKYEVSYLTVNGNFVIAFPTHAEAKDWAHRLKALDKQQGYVARNVKIKEVAC